MAKKKEKAAAVVPPPPPEVPEGVYVLTRDVENPTPDRRSTAMHLRPVWKAGTRLVTGRRYGWRGMEWDRTLRFEAESYPGLHEIHSYDPRFATLVAAMVPAPPDLRSLQVLYDTSNRNTLHVLLDQGVITLAQIEQALKIMATQEEIGRAARLAKDAEEEAEEAAKKEQATS